MAISELCDEYELQPSVLYGWPSLELPVERFAGWLGIARGKFFDWRLRFGKANEHNAKGAQLQESKFSKPLFHSR